MPTKLPTTIKLDSTTGKGFPSTREVHPFVRLQPPPALDADTKQFLSRLQDNVHAATLPSRSDPTIQKVLVQGIKFTGDTKTPADITVRHGLGQSFTGYRCTRAYSGSVPFSAVEADKNGGQDVSNYLVLSSYCTGTYDLEIFTS